MGLLLLLFEVFQICMQGWTYLFDFTNIIDWVLYICSCIFVSTVWLDDCVCSEYWRWQFGSVAVFLAWIDLLVFLRMLPNGMYYCYYNFNAST